MSIEEDTRIVRYTKLMYEIVDNLRKNPKRLNELYSTLYHCGLVDDTGAVIVPDYVNELYDKLHDTGWTLQPGQTFVRLLTKDQLFQFLAAVVCMYHTDLYDGLTLDKLGEPDKLSDTVKQLMVDKTDRLNAWVVK